LGKYVGSKVGLSVGESVGEAVGSGVGDAKQVNVTVFRPVIVAAVFSVTSSPDTAATTV